MNAVGSANIKMAGFERRKPARRPSIDDHQPCPCCGGVLHKLGEHVTGIWRRLHSNRACEAITQPPALSLKQRRIRVKNKKMTRQTQFHWDFLATITAKGSGMSERVKLGHRSESIAPRGGNISAWC